MCSRSEPQRRRAEKAVEMCMEKRGGEGAIRSLKHMRESAMKKKINEGSILKEFLLKSSRTQEKNS